MPEMRKRATDSYREIRDENGAAVLGMLGVSKVPKHTESLRGRAVRRTTSARTKNKSLPFFQAKLCLLGVNNAQG